MYDRLPYPADHILTAYATDEAPNFAALGQGFVCNPVDVLSATSVASGGFSQWYAAGIKDQSGGVWIVAPYRAFSTIVAGTFVTRAYEEIAITAGTTSTATATLTIDTADLWISGYFCLDTDAAGGGTEGDIRRITDNTTTVITFEPVVAGDLANTDTGCIWHPGGIIPVAANYGSAVGVALKAATVGQYTWVLRYGLYPYLNLEAEPGAAVVQGEPITGGANAKGLLARELDSNGAYQPILAHVAIPITTNNEATHVPAMIDCLSY
jgi:hypothetical protein